MLDSELAKQPGASKETSAFLAILKLFVKSTGDGTTKHFTTLLKTSKFRIEECEGTFKLKNVKKAVKRVLELYITHSWMTLLSLPQTALFEGTPKQYELFMTLGGFSVILSRKTGHKPGEENLGHLGDIATFEHGVNYFSGELLRAIMARGKSMN